MVSNVFVLVNSVVAPIGVMGASPPTYLSKFKLIVNHGLKYTVS